MFPGLTPSPGTDTKNSDVIQYSVIISRYNRQFRYEERDGYGQVHGRYGFHDKDGKLQVVNYSAHPDHGFTADVPH
ncbi:putative Insect cuticle protein domain-containing protein 7 [Homarus americanus]|uniref:Putative Insect cuticle protein domain-containing protein 7 n=1 Tax=Homarus americanus TaxID=6706 RepID=A0A8J5JQU2_HOMAM|nr:putative Insect cuticle protein domain-containing protein 7 [Homarus americanus]